MTSFTDASESTRRGFKTYMKKGAKMGGRDYVRDCSSVVVCVSAVNVTMC